MYKNYCFFYEIPACFTVTSELLEACGSTQTYFPVTGVIFCKLTGFGVVDVIKVELSNDGDDDDDGVVDVDVVKSAWLYITVNPSLELYTWTFLNPANLVKTVCSPVP